MKDVPNKNPNAIDFKEGICYIEVSVQLIGYSHNRSANKNVEFFPKCWRWLI